MSTSTRRARRASKNPIVVLLLTLGMIAGIAGLQAVADAATHVTPSEATGSIYPGAVLVRDAQITVNEDEGGKPLDSGSAALTCIAFGRYAKTEIKVEGPAGPGSTVIAGPASKTWALLSPNTLVSLPVDLTNRPAGLYTVTTTLTNTKRASSFSCPASGVTNVVVTKQFEYRPWQHTFTDVLGNGSVKFNITPTNESRVTSGPSTGAVVPGGMAFYAVPDATTFALPSDPTTCATDTASCLPPGATPCDPSAGCEPRIVTISRESAAESISGIFDLETRAFIAQTMVAGSQRLLLSLGTDQDAIYNDVLEQLAAAASGSGINLATILGTSVQVGGGGTVHTLSLLNGLQIDPGTVEGLRINSALGVQAGLLINIYTNLGGPACPAAASGSSTAGDTSYQHSAPTGINVERSDLLPNVPSAGGLDALGVGGPIWHIEGTYNPDALLNTSIVLAGADAFGTDPANGLPVSIEALLTAPLATKSGFSTMDFLGTASWTASETNLGALGCLSVDLVLGVGVAIFNNPLPLGFGDLPLWEANPEMAGLWAQIDAAVADASGQVTAIPGVQDLLDQVLALVPDVT